MENGVTVQIVSQRIGDRLCVRACLKDGAELDRVLLTLEFPAAIPLRDAALLTAKVAEELKRQGSPIVLADARALEV